MGVGEPNLPSKGDLAMQGMSKAVKRPGDNTKKKKKKKNQKKYLAPSYAIDFPSNINNTNYTSLRILIKRNRDQ